MKQTLPPLLRPVSVVHAVAVALALSVASGCATPDAPPEPVFVAPAAVEHTVVRGDALAAIAARYTGDATQWRAIAVHNGIEDPRRLAVGQRIEIPAALLGASGRETAPDGAPPASSGDGARDARSAVPEERPSLAARDEPVVITAVDANRRFELDPLDAPGVGAIERQVRVVGTYYPVAVYTEPRNGAPLARRVSPGTLFPLTRQLDGWWQLDTGAGAVYLRQGDGEVLPSDALPDTPPSE